MLRLFVIIFAGMHLTLMAKSSIFITDTSYNQQKSLQDNIFNAFIASVKKATSQISLDESLFADIAAESIPVVKYQKKTINDELRLLAEFSEPEMKKLITQMNLAVWPEYQRPKTLLWLMQSIPDEKIAILHTDEDTKITTSFQNKMDEYGFQLAFPMDDIENQKIAQILNHQINNKTLKLIQVKYGVDAVLLGRYEDIDSFKKIKWTLYTDQNKNQWLDRTHEYDELAEHSINHLINQFFLMLRPQSKEFHTSDIVIHQINNYKVIQYIRQKLDANNFVKSTHINKINNHQLTLKVSWHGEHSQLENILSQIGLHKVKDNHYDFKLDS
ncbi:MAG: DUF2066 domain-containing protein [Candidatus Comchoanobacterales bacterium]